MLTKKQMKSLPKGEFSNTTLAAHFPKHGLKSRVTILPVDKRGNVTNLTKDLVGFREFRLGRSMARQYGKA